MKLTEEDIRERRETIILTAFHLFRERGIEAVSLSEIAKKSHVGQTTIYRYFDNKVTLVLEAFIRLWDFFMSDVEKSVESIEDYQSLTGYQQIAVWIESFRQLYQKDADFVLFSYEAKLYLVRHQVKLDEFQQDILMHTVKKPCLAALEKGKKDGSIPITLDSEDAFYAMWGSIRGYIVKIVIYDNLYGKDSPWESRYEIMEKGILCALSSGWQPPE